MGSIDKWKKRLLDIVNRKGEFKDLSNDKIEANFSYLISHLLKDYIKTVGIKNLESFYKSEVDEYEKNKDIIKL